MYDRDLKKKKGTRRGKKGLGGGGGRNKWVRKGLGRGRKGLEILGFKVG